jgi:ribosome maturation factor RimP
MDRALLKEKDFARYAGRLVDISLYQGVDGKKNFQGILVGLSGNKIVMRNDKNVEMEFDRAQVAKTRLAVVF